jgi:hypothetical protein
MGDALAPVKAETIETARWFGGRFGKAAFDHRPPGAQFRRAHGVT